ncbi:hypothetical protein DFH11DRAFT_1506822 [Phellopilus nigrolimitatus]|nr:hypothetical protein DFH11DRAFT_1506822 [Phellopilus nigrolimitatus]
MPGEDDQGQAARRALYEYAPDSDTEDDFESGDVDNFKDPRITPGASTSAEPQSLRLEWDWDIDVADRAREAKHDGGDTSFQVDRRVMRDIVKEHMGAEVARIRFISSVGTFHKAYLVTLETTETLIARVARRFMPRLKTESEVATMAYLREHTKIPVPEVYAWDGNPYNRLGGEWILMSRASGIPLRKVYHSMPLEQLVALLRNLAELLMPLFGHRFSHIGSLYSGEGKFNSEVKVSTSEEGTDIEIGKEDHEHVLTPTLASVARTSSVDFAFGSSLPTPTRTPSMSTIGLPTPRPGKTQFSALSMTPTSLSRSATVMNLPHRALSLPSAPAQRFHVGPIISWPFFGSHRGELSHTSFPPEVERGPWVTGAAYARACANREVLGVARENEGRAKPHRLHLDPDDVVPRGAKGNSKKGEYVWGYGFVRRARLAGYGEGDEDEDDEDVREGGSETPSDDRDDSDEESSSGSPSPSIGSDVDEDVMYRDYRRFQRSTFLVAELSKREKRVRNEMDRWRKCMGALEGVLKEVIEKAKGSDGVSSRSEDEGMEMFSLDCHDLSLDNVFVDEKDPSKISCIIDWESTTTRPLWACAHLPSFLLSSPFSSNLFRKAIASLPADRFPHANEWLLLERAGAPLRYAHKCVEWDGWEEGLVGSILGAVESTEAEDAHAPLAFPGAFALAQAEPKEFWEEDGWEEPLVAQMRLSFSCIAESGAGALPHPLAGARARGGDISPSAVHDLRRMSQGSAAEELERERMLNVQGDICGGRGGELGRRLEAWLIETSPERVTKSV